MNALGLLAVTATLLLLSCDATNGSVGQEKLAPVPSTPPTLAVEVGTGQLDFVEFAEGDPVDLVYGSQGGFHVWTAIRVRDERVSDVQVNLSTRLENGAPAGPASRAAVSLSAAGDGWRAAAGLRNFIENAESLRGQRFVVRVEVITRDQQHGSAEKVVIAKGK